MNEPRFKVSFNRQMSYDCEPMNKEAVDLQEEFYNKFNNTPIIKFILLSPNIMESFDKDSFVYDLDITVKEDVFRDIEKMELS